MAAQVVTVAMSDGVPAEEIGRETAHRLAFRYVNDGIITSAARIAGVTPEDIADVERTKSLAERILMALARASSPSGEELGLIADLLPEATDESPLYRELIRQVIWETGKAGRVVIGAHAAGISLATMPSVLRVFITGSPAVRTTRLGAAEGLAEREARRRIDRGDRNRAGYLKRFYGVSKELPTHYDLVLNMDVLPVEAAVQAITSAAQGMG